MLKRLWVVVSVLWSAFWLVIAALGGGLLANASVWVWLCVPWAAGLIAWVSWLFIRSGRRRHESL